MPPRSSLDSEPNRFSFHRLGFEESFNLLKGALDALTKSGVHTLVTVSPVPLSTTFSGQDCITANEYSKAVLRVCAEDICKNNPKIDYFPSFEIVRGIGSDAYIDDNIHVKPEIVAKITDYMISRYREPAAA